MAAYLVTRPEFEALQKQVAEVIEQINSNTIKIQEIEQTTQALTGLEHPGNPIDELTQRIERLEGLAVLREQLDELIAKLNGCDASLGDLGARVAQLESESEG